MTYNVLLNSRGGFKKVQVQNVTSYTRDKETVPGGMYRNTGLAVLDVFESQTGFVDAGSVIGKDDIFTHTAPHQENKDQYYHLFTGTGGAILAFFWDSYVIGVYPEPTV